MPKPILVIQLRPEDVTSDNEFEAILAYGQLPREDAVRLRIETTGIPTDIDPNDYSAIIVGGSPFDISKLKAEKSEIQLKIEQDFKRILDIVVKQDLPFLGICSGNGLLGSYLGTSISKTYGEPISCVHVSLTEAGRQDPLLAGLPDQFEVFLGHKEACDELPAGATLLAEGERCPVQMFRIGRNVYATQFHPELDCKGLELRARTYAGHGYIPNEALEDMLAHVKNKSTPLAQEILRRFVKRYQT